MNNVSYKILPPTFLSEQSYVALFISVCLDYFAYFFFLFVSLAFLIYYFQKRSSEGLLIKIYIMQRYEQG